jgi:serine/threonine-protein kinase
VVQQPPGPPLRPVPDVVGVDQARAARVLRDDGLNVGSVTEKLSDQAPGTVLRTNPRAGAAVWPGTSVELVIAQRGVKVPDVVGKDQAKATRALRDDGLNVGSVTEKVSDQAPGTVLSTNPKAGTAVRPGSAVDLVVAKQSDQAKKPTSGGEVSKNAGAVADRRDKKTG